MSFSCNFIGGYHIATNLCTGHESKVVVPCTTFYSDRPPGIGLYSLSGRLTGLVKSRSREIGLYKCNDRIALKCDRHIQRYGIWCWNLLALEWTPIFTSQSIVHVFSLYYNVWVGVTGPPLNTNWSGRVLQAISSVMDDPAEEVPAKCKSD